MRKKGENGHGQSQKVKFKVNLTNAQNGQKILQKTFGYINMQILHLNLAQLLKVMPKKGEHSL